MRRSRRKKFSIKIAEKSTNVLLVILVVIHELYSNCYSLETTACNAARRINSTTKLINNARLIGGGAAPIVALGLARAAATMKTRVNMSKTKSTQ